MKLTRRDALIALGGGAAVTGGAGALLAATDDAADDGTGDAADDGTGDRTDDDPAGAGEADSPPLSAHDRETAVALARVLYPSEVSGIAGFVRTYLDGLGSTRPDHAAEITGAVSALDEFCRTWWSRPFADLSPERRERAPTEMALSKTDPRPAGTDRERVRYYLVDELLYALYASSTGGELLGIENPPGHPGGIESYQRGPTRG